MKEIQIKEKAFDDPELSRAFRTACNVLGYADRTEGYLREKLNGKKYDPEIVERVISMMKEKGFLNEERMLLRQVEYMSRVKLWGKRRILYEIPQKGYTKETLASFDIGCEELSSIDYVENCVKLIGKKKEEDPGKLFAFLTQYGYSGDEIRRAMKIARERKEEEEEEEE